MEQEFDVVMRFAAVAVLSVCLTTACVHGESSSSSAVTVMAASDGQQHSRLTDTTELSALNALWQSKQKVLLKQRPEFAYLVDFGGSHGRWLYSTDGYIVLAEQPYGTIFRLSDRAQANRLLGVAK